MELYVYGESKWLENICSEKKFNFKYYKKKPSCVAYQHIYMGVSFNEKLLSKA